MKQSAIPYSACHSVFQGGAEGTTTEQYTQFWITLINQMERSKETLCRSQ